jgi:alpha-tubulin suppressor-like RCC1 family protein
MPRQGAKDRWGWAALAVVVVACSAPPAVPPPVDAWVSTPDAYEPPVDAASVCASDVDCDDGTFCNGVERCSPLAPGASPEGCVPAGGPPCTSPRVCRESAHACLTSCDTQPDADGDGHAAPECGGDDCDDADAARNPTATEVCDPLGVDEDCNPATVGTTDADRDGAIDHACRNGTSTGSDCDDARADVHPGAVESCDGVDQDCDGVVDELATLDWYTDADGDGWGDVATEATGCAPPAGVVFRAGDCAPMDDTIHPGAVELCDGIDQDCDGIADGGTASFGCAAGSVCLGGACVAPAGCAAGMFECDGDPATTCETDVRVSPTNCGMCGLACPAEYDCITALCRLRAHATGLSAGYGHVCARTRGGAVACWGSNAYGCLGDGTMTPRIRPKQVPTLLGVDQVSAGQDATCARAGGRLWCWGSAGLLGGATMSNSFVPVQVPGITTAVDVSVGGFVACAVLADATVRCWSGLGVGIPILGDGTSSSSWTPVAVTGITDAQLVRAGTTHVCVLRTTGEVACWGAAGLLGNGTSTASAVAVPVTGVTDAIGLAAANDHSCVVRRGGRVSCWGAGAGLGTGGATIPGIALTPVDTVGIADATAVATGLEFTCAIRAGGRLSCWGNDAVGQVGDGDPAATTPRNYWTVPRDVFASGVTAITAGRTTACAIRDVAVSCWGEGIGGQLGDGYAVTSHSPVNIVELLP